MTALLGGEVNTWLVVMLLVLSLGLAGALLKHVFSERRRNVSLAA